MPGSPTSTGTLRPLQLMPVLRPACTQKETDIVANRSTTSYVHFTLTTKEFSPHAA
jgi:hypothetical protein